MGPYPAVAAAWGRAQRQQRKCPFVAARASSRWWPEHMARADLVRSGGGMRIQRGVVAACRWAQQVTWMGSVGLSTGFLIYRDVEVEADGLPASIKAF